MPGAPKWGIVTIKVMLGDSFAVQVYWGGLQQVQLIGIL